MLASTSAQQRNRVSAGGPTPLLHVCALLLSTALGCCGLVQWANAAPAARVTGSVGCAGVPVWRATVRALQGSQARRQDGQTATDETGQFVLTPKNDAPLLQARLSLLDADGALIALESPLLPMGAARLQVELTLRNVNGKTRQAMASELALCAGARAPKELPQLRKAWSEVSKRGEAAGTVALEVLRSEAARDDAHWLIAMLVEHLQTLERAGQAAPLGEAAQRVAWLGQRLASPPVQMLGLGWQGVSRLMAGQWADAYAALGSATELALQRVRAAVRPGDQMRRSYEAAPLWELHASAARVAGHETAASASLAQAAQLYQQAGQPADAARLLLQRAESALRSSDVQEALDHLTPAANLLAGLDEPGLLFDLALVRTQTLQPAEQARALEQLLPTLLAQQRNLEWAERVQRMASRWIAAEAWTQAAAVLNRSVAWLDERTASPDRDRQLAKALGVLGRGRVRVELEDGPGAEADLRRAWALADSRNPVGTRWSTLYWLAQSLVLQDQFTAGLQTYEQALVDLQSGQPATGGKLADQRMAMWLAHCLAETALATGHPDTRQVLRWLDPAIALAVQTRQDDREATLRTDRAATLTHDLFQANLAALEQAQRDLEAAMAAWQRAKNQDAGQALVERWGVVVQRRAMLLEQAGDRAAAEALVRTWLAQEEASVQAVLATKPATPPSLARVWSARSSWAQLLNQRGAYAQAAALWQGRAEWLQTPEGEAWSVELWNAPENKAMRDTLLPARMLATEWALAAGAWSRAGEAERSVHAQEQAIVALRKGGLADELNDALLMLAMERLERNTPIPLIPELAELEQRVVTPDVGLTVRWLRLMPQLAQLRPAELRDAVAKLEAEVEKNLATLDTLPEARRELVVAMLAAMAVIRLELGDGEAGLALLERASRLTSPAGRLGLLQTQANTYRKMGRLQSALDTSLKLLEWQDDLQRLMGPADRLAALVQVLRVAAELGDHDVVRRARSLAKATAQTIRTDQPLDDTAADALADWSALEALSAFHEDRLTDALVAGNAGRQRRQRAVGRDLAALSEVVVTLAAQAKQRGDRGALADDAQALVVTASSAAQRGAVQAATLAVEAMLAATQTGAPMPTAVALLALRKTLQDAHATASAAGRLLELAAWSRLQALVSHAAGQPNEAIAAMQQAIDAHELVRGSLLSDLRKTTLGEAADRNLYVPLEGWLLDAGRVAEAWVVSERRRGRALIDALATSALRSAKGAETAKATRQLAERAQLLAERDGELDLSLTQPGIVQNGRVQALVPRRKVRLSVEQDEASRVLRQLEQMRRSERGRSAEVLSLVDAPPVQLADLLALAKGRNALVLEWSMLPDRLVTYVVTPAGQVSARTAPATPAQVAAVVRAARHALGADVGQDAARGAAALDTAGDNRPTDAADAEATLAAASQLLLAPVQDLLTSGDPRPVLVVPQRELFLLPFAALPLPGRDAPWGTVTPLAVLPSLGVLRYTAPKRALAVPQGLLVVGDPQMPTWNGQVLPPLPGARREAEAITRPQGSASQVLWGKAATETVVRAAMPQARWIHLATHGVARDDDPGLSFVALAPDAQHDGLLTAADVLDLGLRADLVTLSACQTGLGRVSGDGVLGLGRAFLLAGTPRVVTSLWSVDDDATATLMTALYERLRAGQPPAAALRDAQRTTRTRFADPRQWGAFVLVGEPE